MKKVDQIIQTYDLLSSEEKILLFLKLSSERDMRDHYDPTYKNYRLQVKNFYGQLLVDRNLNDKAFNRREAERSANSFLALKGFSKYNAEFEGSWNEKQKLEYRNNRYVEIILTEL